MISGPRQTVIATVVPGTAEIGCPGKVLKCIMVERLTVHIVDPDSTRRAFLARLTMAAGHHAEIYADSGELMASAPPEGVVLANDDPKGERIDTLMSAMARNSLWWPVIAMAETPQTGDVVSAIKSGAINYVPIPKKIETLTGVLDHAVREAEPQRQTQLRAREAKQRIEQLSKREHEVLCMLVDGASNKSMARDLGLSPRTIEIHRMRMMDKLRAGNVAEAVRMQIEASGLTRLAG